MNNHFYLTNLLGDDTCTNNDSSTSRIAFFSQADDILNDHKPPRGSPRKSKTNLQLASPVKRFCSTSSDLDTSLNGNTFNLQGNDLDDRYTLQKYVYLLFEGP